MAIPFDAGRMATPGSAVPIAQNVQRPIGISAGGMHYAVSNHRTLVYLADNPRGVRSDG